MKQYLQTCEVIDWHHPSVTTLAEQLAQDTDSDIEISRRCFEFVRDQIAHSGDAKHDTTTCCASEVLQHATGWCYAKSHLLAALLRANQIPAGLCYQRLTVESDHAPFCLHGLNAVYLKTYGWYRIDARGNNSNVSAEFTPPREVLAYPPQYKGEMDINGIFAEPLLAVTKTLKKYNDYLDVKNHLPDVELW